MKPRHLVLLAVSLLAALALSACGGGGDDTTGASTDSSSTATLDDFCPAYTALQAKTTALQAASDAQFQERREALHDFVAALDDLSQASPPQIADQVEESAAWARGAEDAVADAKTEAELEKDGKAYTEANPQPNEASQAADAYATKNCDGDKPAS